MCTFIPPIAPDRRAAASWPSCACPRCSAVDASLVPCAGRRGPAQRVVRLDASLLDHHWARPRAASTISPWRRSRVVDSDVGSRLRIFRRLVLFLDADLPSAVLTVWARLDSDVTLISAASGSLSRSRPSRRSELATCADSLTCMCATHHGDSYVFALSGAPIPLCRIPCYHSPRRDRRARRAARPEAAGGQLRGFAVADDPTRPGPRTLPVAGRHRGVRSSIPSTVGLLRRSSAATAVEATTATPAPCRPGPARRRGRVGQRSR